ncbi:MAG: HAMP domain-containing protein [Spirochaetes bacterium]|nr:HAMP domain-containing protein [Spirochaetota bacterium]
MNPANLYLKLPLKFKITIIIILILTGSLLLLSQILYQRQKQTIIGEMEKRGEIILRNLAQTGWEALINRNRAITTDVITELVENKAKYNIVFCMILDKRNRVFDHSDPAQIRKYYRDEYSKQLRKITEVVVRETTYEGEEIIDMAAPIMIQTKTRNVKIGTARIGISKDVLEKTVRDVRLRSLVLTIIFIIVGIVVSFYFAGTITSPVSKIVTVMEKVGHGDLEQKVNIALEDEIGKMADSFNEMIKHLREKMMMQKYVSKSTVEMISKKEDTKVEMGGKRKKITLFFSDIRGFTAFSEARAPEEVISMLNNYLSFQADIIHANGGSVDKFVGDEVMAVFEGAGGTEMAIKSAIQIQKKISELGEKRVDKISVGIGIHAGIAIVGNMGSKDRMDYTAVGDNVNTAARICQAARADQILVTAETYKEVRNKFKPGKTYKIMAKGKSQPLILYEILY